MTKNIDAGLITAKENLGIIRGVSFVLAITFSLLIFVLPHSVTTASSEVNHGLLSLQMLAICCAFVHGIGFSAKSWWGRLLLSPFQHWLIMLSILIVY